jgi:hypothetical protein
MIFVVKNRIMTAFHIHYAAPQRAAGAGSTGSLPRQRYVFAIIDIRLRAANILPLLF